MLASQFPKGAYQCELRVNMGAKLCVFEKNAFPHMVPVESDPGSARCIDPGAEFPCQKSCKFGTVVTCGGSAARGQTAGPGRDCLPGRAHAGGGGRPGPEYLAGRMQQFPGWLQAQAGQGMAENP